MKTWKDTVRNVYSSLDELRAFNDIYGTAERCGFKSAEALWRCNPVIGGSTNPKDFGIVSRKHPRS